MTFSAIVEQFQLEADPMDRSSVLNSLKKRMGELHPDRNGGSFASDEARQTFHDIQTTIDSIEGSSVLVPLNQVTAIVEILAKTVAPLAAAQEESLKAQRITQIRESVRNQHRGIKITSSTFLAMSSALLAFMGSLKDNPVLGQVLELPNAGLVILSIWLYSGVFFAFTWLNERKAESRAEFLATDDGLEYILRELRHENLTPLAGGQLAFSRQHVVSIVSPRHRYRSSPFLFLSAGIGHSAAEAIASNQIDKLLARGIISRAPTKGVQEWFQLDPQLISDN